MNVFSKALAFSLLGFLAGGITSPLYSAEDFESFTVGQIRGKSCEIKPKGDSIWKEPKKGESYKSGSSGKTGSLSTLEVAFNEQNRFRLLPETEIVVDTSTRDPKFRKVIELGMSKGDVEVELDAFPKGYQLKIQTPTAVCGGVGTHFKVKTSGWKGTTTFKSEEGTIFARSSKDASFHAPKIEKGQSVEAVIAPGKENSHTKLEIKGGTIPIAVGSESNKLDIKEGSKVELAQEHTKETKQVAVHIENGGVKVEKADSGNVSEHKEGYYVIDDGKVIDYSKGEEKEKGPALVRDYLVAAKEEGNLKGKLEEAHAKGEPEDKLKEELDQAAEKATEMRRKMLEARGAMRGAVRDGMPQNNLIPRPPPAPPPSR